VKIVVAYFFEMLVAVYYTVSKIKQKTTNLQELQVFWKQASREYA